MPGLTDRPRIAIVSLVVGPLLTTVGDLLHPEEDADPAAQVRILVDHASRWYAAHLLLFLGIVVFIPGVLAVTQLAISRRPFAGYLARVLVLIGVAALTAVFGFEMLLGRFLEDGAGDEAATAVLETFQSGPVFGVLAPFLLAFFAGTGLLAYVLARPDGPFRWPAVILALGAALILIEVVSSLVLFSKLGNFVMMLGAWAFAWRLARGAEPVS